MNENYKFYILYKEDEKSNLIPLSAYKAEKDAKHIVDCHDKNGKSKWGFKLSENENFKIVEVPREITFEESLPSWEDDMKALQEQLDELMSSIGEGEELENVSKEEIV